MQKVFVFVVVANKIGYCCYFGIPQSKYSDILLNNKHFGVKRLKLVRNFHTFADEIALCGVEKLHLEDKTVAQLVGSNALQWGVV